MSPARSRPTQHSQIARSFGGRSGFVSEELDRGAERPEEMSKAERSAAWLLWDESSNHYEEYADENRLSFHRLVPSAELVVVALVVLFFGGGYVGFIAWLALTR